ncbi:MAG TPA: MFS transporter [Allosphingosinicella sp.]|jgi:DHA2 family multidrug resistance protein-like MFS transporter
MTALSASQRIATLAVLAAMALAVLDMGMVNVALPILAQRFEAAPSDAILVISACQAALLVGLLPCAHIADRTSPRAMFRGGVALFCGASLLCALAPSLTFLIAARVLQGLGAAAVMALGVALLRSALGSDRLGSAIAWNALTVALSSAAGPALGAVILSFASWPWLFLAGLPLGAAALLAAGALPDRPATRDAVDAPAIALHAAAVILFLAAAKAAASDAMLALILACSAAPLLALLMRRTRGRHSPMLPADLLGRPSFAVQASASACCFIGQSLGLVALPFHLQRAVPNDLVAAGLVVTCWPLGVAATSLAMGRMSGLDRGVQCAAGGGLLAAGLLLSASLPLQWGAMPLAAGAALCGIGFGLFQLANNRALFLAAPAERAAAAGGIQGTARLTGQTTGTLIMALIYSWSSMALAPRVGLVIGAAFASAAAMLAARRAQAGTGEDSRGP